MKIVLGLVEGRHEMPVEDYVLHSVEDVTDIQGIRKAVCASLVDKLGTDIRVTEYGPSLNGIEEDAAHYECSTELHLYITGLTVVALEVVRFCAMNGIPLVAYHYNCESGSYYPQRII
ncbi:hypothetical protein ACTQZS_07995 [Bilifractor sp. LCP19S3_H10]|uniref:hypothetical protein n=1 Tax=Bilifractor sp. LCP19S3_H10 TaxID=3438736 RepID=UPI003F907437